MRTLIISAFPGCGKTYLTEHQKNLGYYIADIDSYKFKRGAHWEKKYVDYIVNNIGKYDFILISQQDEVLSELQRRNIPFITVAPNNSTLISIKERQLIKQQWFGRFILRNNFHIINLKEWLEKLYKNYDAWTTPQHFKQYRPIKHFALKQDEYIYDIINTIYVLCQNI